MSVIGEFTVQTSVLKDTRDHVPKMVSEVVEVHLTEGDPVNVLIWARNDDFDRLEEGMADDQTIEEYEIVADLGERRLYYLSFTEEGRQAMNYPFSEPYDMVILEATVRHETTEVRALFTGPQSLQDYQLFCDDRGISFTLQRQFIETSPEEEII